MKVCQVIESQTIKEDWGSFLKHYFEAVEEEENIKF